MLTRQRPRIVIKWWIQIYGRRGTDGIDGLSRRVGAVWEKGPLPLKQGQLNSCAHLKCNMYWHTNKKKCDKNGFWHSGRSKCSTELSQYIYFFPFWHISLGSYNASRFFLHFYKPRCSMFFCQSAARLPTKRRLLVDLSQTVMKNCSGKAVQITAECGENLCLLEEQQEQ